MAEGVFTGHWPAMVTPMDEDGRLVLDSVGPLVDKFVREGAGGIYLCGSTGQGPLQTVAEREALAEETLRATAGRLPVMIHVGAIMLEDCLRLARHASRIGAAAVSSVPPIYYAPTLASSMAHYRRVAAAADVPFYAYNFALPGCTTEPFVEGLLSIPTCRGLKFTNVNTYELALLKIQSDGRLNVLSGADECALAAQAQGADGAIGSTQNVGLPLFNAVSAAAEAGHWLAARRLMLQAVRLVHRLTIGHGIAGLHEVLSRQGIPCGRPRHPLPSLDEVGRELAWQTYLTLAPVPDPT